MDYGPTYRITVHGARGVSMTCRPIVADAIIALLVTARWQRFDSMTAQSSDLHLVK